MKLNIIYNEDCLKGMKKLPDNSIDLIVTDPPYGISFMGKQWDKAIPSVDIWKECLRILKPGAFAFVMCIPRQDCLSRMIISLEEAGFNVNFTSIYWAYASGFPKAQNIGRAVDKKLGVKRKILGYTERFGREGRKANCGFKKEYVGASSTQTLPAMKVIDEPATPQAKFLDGSYAGFQPKPALEVVLVAMKPLSEKTYADQALKNRKGITWLDDGRIPFKREDTPKGGFGRMGIGIGKPLEHQKYEKVIIHNAPAGTFAGGEQNRGSYKDYRENTKGRFPANLLVSGDVLNDGRDHKSGNMNSIAKEAQYNVYGKMYQRKVVNKASFGSFSRFFSLDAWWNEKIKNLPDNIKKTFPFLIVPKASKSEKNKGCEDLEIPEYRWNNKGNFQQIKNRRGNFHPTVKPIKLASYLIAIGSRRGDIILDPFAGSGTTLISAKMLGRKYIGYEINPEYYEIAKRRIASIAYQEEFSFDS